MGRRERQAGRGGLAALAALSLVAACGEKAPPKDPTTTTTTTTDGGGTTVEVDPTEAEQVAAIEAAMNHYGPAVHTCWQVAAADDFRVAGTVTLRVVLAGEGRAAKVEVDADDANDPALTKCLVSLWSDVSWPAVFNAGDEIRLPPLTFVAPTGQNVVASAHAVSYPLGKDGKSHATILLDYKNTGNSAGAMTALTMAPGFAVPLHTHTSTEVIYLLKGAGELVDARGARRPLALSAGSAAFIPPGAPHAFKVTGSEPAVALQLYSPGGAEQRFKGIDIGGTTPVKKAPRGAPRVAVMAHAKAPTHTIAAGSVTLLFDAETAPNTSASVAAMTLGATKAVPRHRHDSATEMLFLIEGSGTLTVGDTAREVNRFDAIQIPPGVEHAFVAGDAPVKAIQFYTPAGPEQRFKSK